MSALCLAANKPPRKTNIPPTLPTIAATLIFPDPSALGLGLGDFSVMVAFTSSETSGDSEGVGWFGKFVGFIDEDVDTGGVVCDDGLKLFD